jgi:hypothetical protein
MWIQVLRPRTVQNILTGKEKGRSRILRYNATVFYICGNKEILKDSTFASGGFRFRSVDNEMIASKSVTNTSLKRLVTPESRIVFALPLLVSL